MSTITKEFTKEQLQQIIETDHVQCGEASSLARIALASLEAEPVCVIDQSNLDYLNAGSDADVWPVSRTEMGDVLLYRTAPPAPANAEPVAWLWSHRKHPSEVSLVRPEDDEKAEGAHWSGWSCQALYAAPPAPVSVPAAMEMDDDFDSAFEHGKAVGWNAYRDAMLKHSEPFIVTSDHRMMEMPQVEAINAVTAMLQGVEPVTTAYKLQDGWVACSERMPEIGIKVLCFPVNDEPIHATYNGQVWLQDISWSASDEPIDNVISCNVFHWMPLPAAPQQEA
ncbi:DUF551 domain-containing protein [Enterobacter cloacae complex sp. 379A2]|uniref:DUF551 domain-containing protein n=1 Tax=Enterobacter cloacae complex sp. 379A2 TaxID=3395856 RepID=UPI003CF792A7